MKTIGFIGGGRITRIFLEAFSNDLMVLDHVAVYDPDAEILKRLKHNFPQISVYSNEIEPIVKSDLVFLAIHPPVMMATLSRIREIINPEATLISLAPKFTLERIGAELKSVTNIARINPSASTIIKMGINPVCFSPGTIAAKRTELTDLMKPLGFMPEVEEAKIEAYAMISAMGHTYFWFQLQKLKELAMVFGMDTSEAENVISRMMLATVETLFHSGLTYAEVADLVPVKPLGPVERNITAMYDEYLVPLYEKIRP